MFYSGPNGGCFVWASIMFCRFCMNCSSKAHPHSQDIKKPNIPRLSTNLGHMQAQLYRNITESCPTVPEQCVIANRMAASGCRSSGCRSQVLTLSTVSCRQSLPVNSSLVTCSKALPYHGQQKL